MPCDRLDIDRIVSQTFVARAEHHRSLTSTNDRAGQCASQAPAGLPLLIVADRQTSGRGRGSNRWWTGRGSLAFSLLVEADRSGTNAARPSPLAALAAAVAVVETVARLVSPQAVGIHWPNDVMAAGRKLAGILVEVLPNRRQVIGVGLNANNRLAEAPPELQQTATTLWELTGGVHDRTALLISLLGGFQAVFQQLAARPEQIAAAADRVCLQHGKTLAIELGKETITGRCLGIAPDGALLLQTPQGRRSFYSGTLS